MAPINPNGNRNIGGNRIASLIFILTFLGGLGGVGIFANSKLTDIPKIKNILSDMRTQSELDMQLVNPLAEDLVRLLIQSKDGKLEISTMKLLITQRDQLKATMDTTIDFSINPNKGNDTVTIQRREFDPLTGKYNDKGRFELNKPEEIAAMMEEIIPGYELDGFTRENSIGVSIRINPSEEMNLSEILLSEAPSFSTDSGEIRINRSEYRLRDILLTFSDTEQEGTTDTEGLPITMKIPSTSRTVSLEFKKIGEDGTVFSTNEYLTLTFITTNSGEHQNKEARLTYVASEGSMSRSYNEELIDPVINFESKLLNTQESAIASIFGLIGRVSPDELARNIVEQSINDFVDFQEAEPK